MPEAARIRELRRQIEADPGSLAFVHLAEAYRQGGAYEAAIATCRSGLSRHPGCQAARLILARCLVESGVAGASREERPGPRDPALPPLEAFLAAVQRRRAAGATAGRPG